VARYDAHPAWRTTPGGRSVLVFIREGTNDHNTAFASLDEDEYHLAPLPITGHAIDVGGYLGTVALGLLVDHPDLRVTIVEPIPENLALIRLNLESNGVAGRATIVDGAIGASAGTLRIHYGFSGDEMREHHAFVGNISLIEGIGPDSCPEGLPHRHVDAPIVTFSELVRPETSFVKIDCEGGEWAAFRDPAIRSVPRIHGEIHPTDGHVRDDLLAFLPDHRVTFAGTAMPTEFQAVR